MHRKLKVFLCVLFIGGAGTLLAQDAPRTTNDSSSGDLELIERLLVARRDYQKALEDVRAYYLGSGDVQKAKWAEQELIAMHRIPKRAFRLELDVPPPTLRGDVNIPAANKLYSRAMTYKGNGFGTQFIDNQRRAELLLQQLLTRYPQSNRISDAAFQLGDIYEKAPYEHHLRAARYFERCFEWNPATHFNARLRAARIYDQQLLDRKRAMEIYKEVLNSETDTPRKREALQRMKQITGAR